MWLDLVIVAAILIWGNIQFRRFKPHLPVWRRAWRLALSLRSRV